MMTIDLKCLEFAGIEDGVGVAVVVTVILEVEEVQRYNVKAGKEVADDGVKLEVPECSIALASATFFDYFLTARGNSFFNSSSGSGRFLAEKSRGTSKSSGVIYASKSVGTCSPSKKTISLSRVILSSSPGVHR
jgi:hypothetical protein